MQIFGYNMLNFKYANICKISKQSLNLDFTNRIYVIFFIVLFVLKKYADILS